MADVKNKEKTNTKTSVKEPSDWDKLYEYVKKEILQYSDNMKLSKYMILRLNGLSNGVFISNKNIKPMASYDYEIILTACKICKSKIHKYLQDNESKIKDEQHRVNLIMMFLEQEINDVVLRMKKVKKANEKIENIDLGNQIYEGTEYKSKSEKRKKKLDSLW